MKRYGFSLIVLLIISFYAFPQGEHLKVVDNWLKTTDAKSSLYNHYLGPVLLHATAIEMMEADLTIARSSFSRAGLTKNLNIVRLEPQQGIWQEFSKLLQ